MTRLRVHGQGDAEPARRASPLQRALPDSLTIKHSVRVGLARDGRPPVLLEQVSSDDVVEIELDGGLKLWSRVDDLERELGLPRRRDAAGSEAIEIGARLTLGGRSRGTGDWVIKGLKVLGVDLAGQVTGFVRDRVEGRLTPGPALYRCALREAGALSTPRPIRGGATLVLLHGTGSSTDGSFGDLWRNGESRAEELAARYDDRVLALQHRTLSQSPIQNARELMLALQRVVPAGSELHLVSHSRGGLIGELIARGNRVGGDVFDDTDRQLLKRAGRAEDAAALRELDALLRKQRYVVSRFVRVACPARGTTLAGGRLDRYLSIVLNVLETIPGLKESLVFDTFASLLAAVLKKRLSPSDLPGLEAMTPGSPLVRMLNRPDVQTAAGLHVLGGDVEGTGFWGRLKVFATDLYYREDHDLVVNTPAMFGGAERTNTVQYWIDTGGRVNHFNYFANADTASRLLAGLTGDSASEFHAVEVPLGVVTEGDYRKRAPVPQPVVFVLPGFMGSELAAGGRRVWVDAADLARGHLDRLRAKAPRIAAVGLIGSAYRDLVRHLAASHEVVPFPYDWRQSLDEAAARLGEAVNARLTAAEQSGQPIRFLAHGEGGLVVRAWLATPAGRKTWDRVCRHPGARFVMLGTPNGGSHAAAALLLGRDEMTRQLALLDFHHTHGQLVSTFAEYAGLLQLLPHGGTIDLYDAARWSGLHRRDTRSARSTQTARRARARAGVDWRPPSPALLSKAAAMRDVLRASPIVPGTMVYVAGTADETPCDLVISRTGGVPRVTVLTTADGDGRVPWSTGVPKELHNHTYYVGVAHGDLANDDEHFPALVDLLDHGRTSKLSHTPPVGRDTTSGLSTLVDRPIEAFPSEASLVRAALGTRRRPSTRRATPRARVRVVHGNLIWARSPVVVGHYSDDVIVGAEALLDRQLDGRLRELHRRDLYPNGRNRAVVVLNDGGSDGQGQHAGAVVAGLGPVGELTPGGLTAALTHAFIQYGDEAISRERRRRKAGTSSDSANELPLGITPLLVGAGAGGVKIGDSLQSILRAVQHANARLTERAVHAADRPTASGAESLRARIVTVDVLELFEDRAIQIVRELQAFGRVAEFRSEFVLDEVLAKGEDGTRRATFDELPGWWQRLRITQQGGTLKFESLTERAGGEALTLSTQTAMVRELLHRAVQSTATDLDLSATLFELLVPRALKERAPDQRPIVLVVDDSSSMLPWELMHDRWSAGSRPLSVDTGMVRQLVSAQSPSRSPRAVKDAALVIGDPPLEGSKEFGQLPGAAAEAESVAAALREQGFETTAFIGDKAQWPTLLATLFGEAHRVLHIAAHGVYRFDHGGEKVTGVVLGNGAFLRPAELAQLRVVPDLVFINCCHLAHQGEYDRAGDTAFPELAANVAQQLIGMGVRAVVAAGWAVDDQAALEFARAFYREMLDGREFGEAVLTARQEIFTRFPGMNTWGAYQCYGDPGFALRLPTRASRERRPVAERELEYAVAQLANRVRGGRDRKDRLLTALEQLIDSAQPDWLMSGSTCAEIARAYAELGQLDEAVRYYDRVLSAEPASATVASVEQLANMLARLAESQKAPALAVMERSAELLEHLCQIGTTVERLSLVGATWKRRALKSSGMTRLRDLRQMTRAYVEGYELAHQRGRRNAWYPLGNAIAGALALRWLSPGEPPDIDVASSLTTLRKLAARVSGDSRDFWELQLPADVTLLEAADRGSLSAAERAALVTGYRSADRAATPRELASAAGQIVFLRNMAKASRRSALSVFAASLDKLRQTLDQQRAGGPPAAG